MEAVKGDEPATSTTTEGSSAPISELDSLDCPSSDTDLPIEDIDDGLNDISARYINIDIPTLKRRFDKLKEETGELEKDYNERKSQVKASLLKGIKEYEQKKSAWKAKIVELNKLSGEDTG